MLVFVFSLINVILWAIDSKKTDNVIDSIEKGLDKSKIKIQIDSVLDKGNYDCVMNQVSRILTLGEVEAEIIPNMFTHEDSVEAKHGSVIGSFRDEELFYLMSRGISFEEAITLLIKGFIFSNLIVDMEKRAKIFQIIQNLRR